MVHMVRPYWLTHKKYSCSIIQLLINCLFFIYFLNIEAINYHLLKGSKSTTIWVFPMYLISFPKHREPATCICLYLLFISKYLYVANNMEILIYFHKKVARSNWYFLHSYPTPCILMLSSIRCCNRHSNHLYFLIVIVTSLYISSPSSWRSILFLKYKYE